MADEQVVTCAECGGKNRVPTSALARGARARCGYCGTLLPVYGEQADVALLRPAVIERGAPGPRRRGRWLFGFLTGVVVTAVALYVVDRRTDLQAIEVGSVRLADMVDRSWNWLRSFVETTLESTAEPEPTTAPTPSATEAPPAPEEAPAAADGEPDTAAAAASDEPAPAADVEPDTAVADVESDAAALASRVLFNRTGREAVAPLNIVSGSGRDYFVKLVDSATGEDAVGILVRGGSPAAFDVPLGIYEIRYASGSAWQGLGALFGPDTAYAKAAGIFIFRQEGEGYVGRTVILSRSDRNSPSDSSIEPDSF